MNFFTSPLEQFLILPIFSLQIGLFDLSLTNATVILLLILFFSVVFFLSLFKSHDSGYFLIPNRWQAMIEIVYNLMLSLVTDNIRSKKKVLHSSH